MQGLRRYSALFCTTQKARVRQPPLIFSERVAVATPDNVWVTSRFRPLLGSGEGGGVRQPLLIFSARLALGTPENAGVT